MNNAIPRIAAVHDISGFGKCSLTVAIPVLSAMGIEVCPLPTALLSTHTGGFEGYSFRDMTVDMTDIINHWKSLGIKFNAIYSGFLGNSDQVDILIDFIDKCKHNELLVVVDPVLGDHGKLYSSMSSEMVEKMRKLVSYASLITPNVTEAALLLGEECITDIMSDDAIFDRCRRLSDLGAKMVVITSVMNIDNKMYVVTYDKQTDKITKIPCSYTHGVFHGTGDV